MASVNKSSLNNILKAVLSIAKQEQNTFYSPKVYSEHRNVIESLLLSALVKEYPVNQSIIDIIAPFVKTEIINNTNGYIQLPDDYRNLLGSPVVFANEKNNGECADIGSIKITPQTFKQGVLKAGCNLNPIIILPQSEFAYRTKSEYDLPSWEEPIGQFVDGNRIKVCPYNTTRVGVMYVKKESEVIFGYIQQPDDTYLYDKATTIDTQFDSAAYEPIFNGIMALYAAYSKDQQMMDWAQVLKVKGIL